MTEQNAAGRGKADFDHIYDRPDPREYYRTLGALDYEIPQRALPIVLALLAALRAQAPDEAEPPRVLDVCCSYGINAALLRCDLTLAQMYDRFTDPAMDELSAAQVRDADKAFYAERPRDVPMEIAGLDIAGQAVDYGCQVGLLDRGFAENLEESDPSPALQDELARTDLIVTTGGVGYITGRTFDRLLTPEREAPAPWVVAFVLRMFSYDGISATLAQHGLRTEHLEGVSLPQRRFATDAERDVAVRGVSLRGLDPTGLESDGRYYADLYLSRPDADVERLPLQDLLTPTP